MKLDALLKSAKVLPLFALLVAYGCSGGGSGGTASVPPAMQPGTGTGMQPAPLEPARSAPGLGDLFSSEPARTYTPVATSLVEDYSASTAELSTTPFVSSIERNASGGYDIVYQDGAEQLTVSVLPEHCQGNWRGCEIPADQNGRRHWFSSWTNPDSLGEPYEFKFLEASFFTMSDGSGTQRRSMFVFGIETPASDVPATGEAVYIGRMRARAYRTSEPGGRIRQRYRGYVRLVANFDMSQLNGRIISIQGTAPGEPSSARVSWPTSSFAITNGQIANGQFTADLTGMDSDSAVPDAESVRGFVGSIVAKFYGPNADEFGGTLTASRDLQGTDNDRQLHGFVVGTKLAPRVLGTAASAAGIRRRFGDQETVLIVDDGMATVERTANGWTVTVGGQTYSVPDTAYHSNPSFPYMYYYTDATGDRAFWTWTRGLQSTSRFDHFDVKGWGTGEPSGMNPTVGDHVFLVHGNRTPQDAVPTSGTANYSGEMEAREFPSDQAVLTRDPAVVRYSGSADMTADFAASSVTGTLSLSRKQPGTRGQWTSASGGATFNAQISGNGLTASDLTGTGDLAGYQNGTVRGSFFGPAAEEMGGVFDAEDTSGNRVISGYFGARKDQ